MTEYVKRAMTSYVRSEAAYVLEWRYTKA